MTESVSRAQCIIHRGNKLLIVKLKHLEDGHEFWCMPGGRIEEGETPAEAAIRELKEECGVVGTVVRELGDIESVSEGYNRIYSFLTEIGTQEPVKGTDPDCEEERLLDVGWLSLAEIPERDRAFLWAFGLLGIEEFRAEAERLGDSISYPNLKEE